MSEAANTGKPDLGFDPVALKTKYRAERDKRLRKDGNQQYVEISGQYAHYLEDPYVARIERAPMFDQVEVVVVGGGFGGLLAGARLKQAGIEDVRIIEKGGDFGGTWYWNRYPGAACDIESYVYLPLLEEVGYMPVEKYTRAPEILKHSRAIGETFGLYKGAIFQTEVTKVAWDEATSRWTISTNRGDALKARYVVLASGPLHRPKLPGIPGVETFKGHSFHTSRWDYAYTGGDSTGGLTGLKDKVVGIIGTGATAVQCVPHLAAGAKQLYVFQRTPSSIDVRNNKPTDPEWVKSLTPGWQKRRMDNFNTLVSGGWQDEDLVNDGWTDIIRNILILAGQGAKTPQEAMELAQLADFKKMESIRARVDSIIQHKPTADALKPWYNQFCKRPCFHDDYLGAFNRPECRACRYQREGRRAHQRNVGLRQRQGIQGRLPDLCDRLRSRHHVQPPRQYGAARPQRPDAHREMERRRLNPARHARERLPQRLHHRQHPVRLHRQLPPHDRRTVTPPRLHPRPGGGATGNTRGSPTGG